MNQQTYIIKFEDTSDADANRYASELRDILLDAVPNIEVRRRRDNPYTQDLGATLILVLGTPAAVTIVKAVGNWLALRRGTITIERDGGEITKVTGTNLTSEAQLKMLEIFTEK
jgi:Effector Associated Constant Component 1